MVVGIGGVSSADGLTNISLDEQPDPEEDEEEWTQVLQTQSYDLSLMNMHLASKPCSRDLHCQI